MENTFRQLKQEADKLFAMMEARGFDQAKVSIEAISGSATTRIALSWASPGIAYRDKYEFIHGDTVAGAVHQAEGWIASQPAPVERAAKEIEAMTKRMLRECVKLGISGQDLADAVARLAGNEV